MTVRQVFDRDQILFVTTYKDFKYLKFIENKTIIQKSEKTVILT